MKSVSIFRDAPGHEGEYVVHIKSPESEWPTTLVDGFHDLRYSELKELIFDLNIEVPGDYLDNYSILNRGNRLEIVGPKDDELIGELFRRLEIEVEWRSY